MKNNNSGVRYGCTAGKNTAESILNIIRSSKPEQSDSKTLKIEVTVKIED